MFPKILKKKVSSSHIKYKFESLSSKANIKRPPSLTWKTEILYRVSGKVYIVDSTAPVMLCQ